jgi:hypothetical protein
MQQRIGWISILILGLGGILVWFWNGAKEPAMPRDFLVLYLDLSEATDYLRVIEEVEKLTQQHPQHSYLFLSNGKHPVIARKEGDKRAFIQAIQGTERLVPNVRNDLALIRSDSTLYQAIAGGDSLQIKLFLSPTIHRLSGQILLDGLYTIFAPLALEQSVQIITENPIPARQQLQSPVNLTYHIWPRHFVQ